MKALRFLGPWTIDIGDVPDPPEPVDTEVLIRIRATGICGTDLGIVSGEYDAVKGVILGHEAAGDVVAVGDAVNSVAAGDRVAIDPTYSCGFCRMCRTNRSNHCERKHGTEAGVSRDGTLAEYYLCEERFVHRLQPRLSFAAGTLGEPLSCALTGVARLNLHLAHRVAVVGGGPMGILYAWALSSKGMRGCIVENAAARREALRAVLPEGWALASSLDDVLRHHAPVDVAVDTTGAMTGRLLDIVARGGQVLTIGLSRHLITVDAGAMADCSITLLGSIDSLDNSFAAAVDLLSFGAIPAEQLVTHRITLDNFAQGAALLGCDIAGRRRGPPNGALKVVVEPAQAFGKVQAWCP